MKCNHLDTHTRCSEDDVPSPSPSHATPSPCPPVSGGGGGDEEGEHEDISRDTSVDMSVCVTLCCVSIISVCVCVCGYSQWTTSELQCSGVVIRYKISPPSPPPRGSVLDWVTSS